MLTSVAVLALPGVAPFEFGIGCEVFGIDRSEDGVPVVDFRIVTPVPGPVTTSMGYAMTIGLGLDAAAGADLVLVPATTATDEGRCWTGTCTAPACTGAGGCGRQAERTAVRELLEGVLARGGRVLSLCTGAMVLGASGLLDGRRCTTHWRHTTELQRRHPGSRVDADVLYVVDGGVITSAGTAAGIDACLHVVRTEWGARAATAVARRMVVPPHRDGGQAQYVTAPVPVCRDDDLTPVMEWLLGDLDQERTVADMARRARMSSRTFARRFTDATGSSPGAWLNRQRLVRAQELLEGTDLPVDTVARRVGWGSSAVLRHHFAALGTTPSAYRRTFAG